jgi:hypothetical protein
MVGVGHIRSKPMEVKCKVFVDGGHTPVLHTFSIVPRIGEWITLSENDEPSSLIVEQVEHVIDGRSSDASPAITMIHARRRKI